jgi:uncharacterized membrane protein YhaH (DUF805 family)
MSPLSFLSPAGQLAPLPFAITVGGVYLAGFASQTLLSPPVTGPFGVVPFALAQAALIWTWFVLHARRLHDAGRSVGLAAGVALVYALDVVLLVILTGLILAYADAPAERGWADVGILHLFVFLYLLTLPVGDSSLGALQAWIIGSVVLMLLPVVIAICFSLWAATRPSAPPPPSSAP